MQLYLYNKFTNEYEGEREAFLDPLETQIQGKEVYLYPPYTTTVAPVEPEEGKAVIFNIEKNEWESVADYRGQTVYHKKTKEPITIVALGNLPVGYVLELPYNLQDAKIDSIKEINAIYEIAKANRVSIGKVKVNIADRIALIEVLKGLDEEHNQYYFDTEEESILLTKEEIEEIVQKLYERSMELPKKRNEFIEEIKACKSKKQLEKVVETAGKELI